MLGGLSLGVGPAAPSDFLAQLVSVSLATTATRRKPALPAGPAVSLLDPNVGQIGDVVKPFPAKGSIGIPDEPSFHVDLWGDRFQVGRIDAGRHPAQVVHVGTVRDGANELSVEGTVGDGFAIDDAAEASVTLGVEVATPDPAPPVIDLITGPIVEQGLDRLEGAPQAKSLVMLRAHAPDESAEAAGLSRNALAMCSHPSKVQEASRG